MKKQKIAIYEFERNGATQGGSTVKEVIEAPIIPKTLPSWGTNGCCSPIYNPVGKEILTVGLNGVVYQVNTYSIVPGIDYSIQLIGGTNWKSKETILAEISKLEKEVVEGMTKLTALRALVN